MNHAKLCWRYLFLSVLLSFSSCAETRVEREHEEQVNLPRIPEISAAYSYTAVNYIGPGPAPKLKCPRAMELAKSKLMVFGGAPDSYINKIELIFGDDDEHVWVIWFASPTRGYAIIAVQMDGRVRKATRMEVEIGRGFRIY